VKKYLAWCRSMQGLAAPRAAFCALMEDMQSSPSTMMSTTDDRAKKTSDQKTRGAALCSSPKPALELSKRNDGAAHTPQGHADSDEGESPADSSSQAKASDTAS
jgi:hypothetical protein